MNENSRNNVISIIISFAIASLITIYCWFFNDQEILAKDYLKNPSNYVVDTIIQNNIIEYSVHYGKE